MAPPTNCPKIKPYTVIDLSTRTVLSDEEVNTVLNQASQKEYLKSIGEYAYNGNHAKANGDPPNFLMLPQKVYIWSFFFNNPQISGKGVLISLYQVNQKWK